MDDPLTSTVSQLSNTTGDQIRQQFMIYLKTILLLICSNLFMTFAWYAHLKNFQNKALWIAILASWSIALFEYIFQVPANRIGFYSGEISLAQLKIIQEVITLSVFVPFAVFYMRQPLTWNFLGAGICLIGAVYFIFR
jgi:uncharacterized protein (DUF486 family)